MTPSQSILARAGKILREHSASPEATAALVVAASAFVGIATKEPKADGEEVEQRFMRLLREAAALLSPVCPHCGKELAGPSENGSDA